jgi:hypothetical protein
VSTATDQLIEALREWLTLNDQLKQLEERSLEIYTAKRKLETETLPRLLRAVS